MGIDCQNFFSIVIVHYPTELNFRTLCSMYKNLQIIQRNAQKKSNTLPLMGSNFYKWVCNCFRCFLNFLLRFLLSLYEKVNVFNIILIVLEIVSYSTCDRLFFFLFINVNSPSIEQKVLSNRNNIQTLFDSHACVSIRNSQSDQKVSEINK